MWRRSLLGGLHHCGGAHRGGLPADAVRLGVGEVLGGVLRAEQGRLHRRGVSLARPLPVTGLVRRIVGALPIQALRIAVVADLLDGDRVGRDLGLHPGIRAAGVGLLPRAGQIRRLFYWLLLCRLLRRLRLARTAGVGGFGVTGVAACAKPENEQTGNGRCDCLPVHGFLLSLVDLR